MYKRILEIITDAATEVSSDMEKKINLEKGEDAPLFGPENVLDSLDLVSLVVIVEQAIEDEYNIILTLADSRAFSQKNSPFRTIGALASYAYKLAKEALPGE